MSGFWQALIRILKWCTVNKCGQETALFHFIPDLDQGVKVSFAVVLLKLKLNYIHEYINLKETPQCIHKTAQHSQQRLNSDFFLKSPFVPFGRLN